MRIQSRIIKILCVLLFAIFIGLVALIVSVAQEANAKFILNIRSLIPPKIVTEEILVNDFEQALPGTWCNVLVFKINKEALHKIRSKELDFFKDQIPGKNWVAWEKYSRSNLNEAFKIPQGCFADLKKFEDEYGVLFSKNTEGYYTFLKDLKYSNISVFPDLGIAVYASWTSKAIGGG